VLFLRVRPPRSTPKRSVTKRAPSLHRGKARTRPLSPDTRSRLLLLLLGACAVLCSSAQSAAAQERYSQSESLRSVVTPSLIWRFNAGASITTLPSSDALITLPHLGFAVGSPGVVAPRGLELSASLIDFVVAPDPPAFGFKYRCPVRRLSSRGKPTRALETSGSDGANMSLPIRTCALTSMR
jgi:hypothetical protein